MKLLFATVLALVIPCSGFAQDRKTPVSVSHTGKDQVGVLFVAALDRELSNSNKYRPLRAGENESGLRFYVDLISIDPADTPQQRERKSVISVVVQDFGLPNSFPVSDMWYHRVIVVERENVDTMAKTLLEDMFTRWVCRLRNSLGDCPKGEPDPTR